MRTLYMVALVVGVTTALRAPSPICMAKAKAGKKKAVKPKVAARGFGAAPTAAPAKSAADPEWSAFINWLDKSGATTDAVALASFGGLLHVRRETRMANRAAVAETGRHEVNRTSDNTK